ncbi:MAG: hypothetical protein RR738_08845 [Anaerorhabdus sp.]|uniref:HTH domain-containing protein n=1 Tax=Anaerorhabdus sp. TaxID=1872524 RepID=UPI002FCA8450
MGKNRFSKETIDYLKGNQYIKKITETQIVFTNEFKEIIVEKHSKGIKPIQIFIEAGIPYQVLGKTRINSAIRQFEKQNQRSEGFARVTGSGRPKNVKLEFKSVEEELQYYKNRAEYLEQENDFIKKIQALEEKEAARLSRVKNSKS